MQFGERPGVWLAYGDVFLYVLIAAILLVDDIVRLCGKFISSDASKRHLDIPSDPNSITPHCSVFLPL